MQEIGEEVTVIKIENNVESLISRSQFFVHNTCYTFTFYYQIQHLQGKQNNNKNHRRQSMTNYYPEYGIIHNEMLATENIYYP